MMPPLSPKEILAISDELMSVMLEDRHHLHQYPELSFQEENTTLYIQTQLKKMGLACTLLPNRGVVAHFKGKLPGEKVVALRADFDALPIQEQNEKPYKSRNTGVMHACGHDVHTAALLGVARILLALQPRFGGTVKFLFQPAEEKFPGGARAMVEAGALKGPDVDVVLAQHVMPELEAGKVGVKAGRYAAANDEVNITIKGRGGHGALPHALVDPVIVAAQILLSMQTIVSRVANPTEPTVLSFGKIVADGANNIIPEVVHMYGTLRTFDKAWRQQAHEKIKQISQGIAEAMGASCEVHIQGFSNVENDEPLTAEVIAWSREFLGEENVVALDYWMAGEDFGEFARDVPGCYYRIGSGNVEKGIDAPLHNPRFDVDEEPLFRISSALMTYIALKKLGN
ncbi:N-acyl-L-amino acid amidohydrolase [Niastella koreensis]|uniref:Amidohydrolase n=2 Tax=Niastella koreensis TaxID=354356 RepID=G8T754_NIAKG|nr:amidohydrolase [Niastella koreensis]AEW00079.1 amidohydrolase [Niastella koreensis GR20-10]OQP49612.1 N-acyl-L-amino acid amidohydrolase [Niastella koreensis]